MKCASDFADTYRNMSDGQLLQTANEGQLVDEAKDALEVELNHRHLKKSDLSSHIQPQHVRLREETQEKTLRHGTGLVFFGRSYLNAADKEAGIQLRTKWVAFMYVPLIPLASFRFRCEEKHWMFFQWNSEQRALNRVPLNWNQVFLTWLKAVLVLATIIGAILLSSWIKGNG